MSTYIGIDPDLHHAGIAVLDSNKREPLFFGVARQASKLTGEQANALAGIAYLSALSRAFPTGVTGVNVIVESQGIYVGSAARPDNILMLAQNAGVAAGVCASYFHSPKITLVKPRDWKGTISNDNFDPFLTSHLKWRGPAPIQDVKESEWVHVRAAMGLACYGIIRDQLPRAADRPEGERLRGMTVSSGQLSRLEARLTRRP